MKKFKVKYVLIFIIVFVVIIAIVGISQRKLFNSKEKQNIDEGNLNEISWPVKEVYLDNNQVESSVAVLLPWDKMSIYQQFPSVKYGSNNYASKNVEISEDMITEKLGNATLTGKDDITGTKYTENAELYAIKGLSNECVIALKFVNMSQYYVYRNIEYKPSTLGQLIEDLNLKETLSFETVYYNYDYVNENGDEQKEKVEFSDVDDDVIWNMLFDDLSLKNVYEDKEWPESVMSISVNISVIGYKNISVALSKDGYLTTNILDSGKCFYIGEDKVQEFINYVVKNCEGYRIVYINSNENNDENVTTEDESIEVYDVKNNTTDKVILNSTENNRTTNSIPAYDPSVD